MPTIDTLPYAATMNDALSQLRGQISRLGLKLSLWDVQGRCISPTSTGCEFCQILSGCSSGCADSSAGLAGKVINQQRSCKQRGALGCCIIGVPVFQRRRLIGAAVACYPPRELAEEENLARLCDRLQLDRRVMSKSALDICRNSADQADNFLMVMTWLIEQEQAIANSRSELVTLSTHLTTAYEELNLLYRISGSMRLTNQPEQFLQSICNELLDVMDISAAVGISRDYLTANRRDIIVTAGEPKLSDSDVKHLAAVCLGGNILKNNRAIVDNNFAAGQKLSCNGAIHSILAAPMTIESPARAHKHDKSMGMLIGINRTSGDFDSVDIKLITSIASQTAVFLSNHRLYADLQDLLMGVLHALTASVDAKDPYTCGHSQRVAMISRKLAETCGFAPEQTQRIYLAGLLHDVGKIGVPESVLCKPGKLTSQEYEVMKRHPVIGARILSGIRQLDDLIDGILLHHERPDGKGYPKRLVGDQTPMMALIVGLADSFDAMTSNRTYRRALPLETVIAEIRNNAGKQFDSHLAERFLSLNLVELMDELRQPATPAIQAAALQEIQR